MQGEIVEYPTTTMECMMAASTKPLPAPKTPVAVASDTVVAGPMIPAIDRIKLFSSDEWENFVFEWADSLRER